MSFRELMIGVGSAPALGGGGRARDKWRARVLLAGAQRAATLSGDVAWARTS